MPARDDAETATGHHLVRSLSSAPGHVIATSGVAVFMKHRGARYSSFGSGARDVLFDSQ
jgi:hypothetical protein